LTDILSLGYIYNLLLFPPVSVGINLRLPFNIHRYTFFTNVLQSAG